MKTLIRKIKAIITGKKPCTFETAHGHDFVRVGEIKSHRGFKFARFDCRVCGMKVMYDQLSGGFEKI